MALGSIVGALACFVGFGAAAVVMARTAVGDWREARAEHDSVLLLVAVETWWPAGLCALLALGGPILILRLA